MGEEEMFVPSTLNSQGKTNSAEEQAQVANLATQANTITEEMRAKEQAARATTGKHPLKEATDEDTDGVLAGLKIN